MNSLTTCRFKGKVSQEIELIAKIDLIDQLTDTLCSCELTTEGRVVLGVLKLELINKLNEISNIKN